MPIRKASNTGIGVINKTFPIWELGADLYWRSASPLNVQIPGGSGYKNFVYTETVDDYYIYDVGAGHFRQIPIASPEFPPDGFCPPARTNLWDDTQTSQRGFTSVDDSLSETFISPVPSTHILDPNSVGISDVWNLGNDTGDSLRISRSEGISSSLNRIFSVLVKEQNGAIVNGGVVELFASTATSGVPNEGGNTIYTKIRDDGWYHLSMVREFDASSDSRYFGVEIKPGKNVYIEMPALEGTNTNPQLGTFPAPDIGTKDSKGVFKLDIADIYNAGYPSAGWMGCSIVFPYGKKYTSYPFGWLVNWAVDANNYILFEMSTSRNHFVAVVISNGDTQVFLGREDGITIDAGETLGAVLMWNPTNFFLYINGEYIGIDSTFVMPTGTPTSLNIGYDPINGRYPAICIQSAAISREPIGRSEAKILSKWFQNQALSVFGG